LEVGSRVEIRRPPSLEKGLRMVEGWHDAYVAGFMEGGGSGGGSSAVTVAISDGGNTTLLSLQRGDVALVAAGEILSEAV
jgi:hypothetical protein